MTTKTFKGGFLILAFDKVDDSRVWGFRQLPPDQGELLELHPHRPTVVTRFELESDCQKIVDEIALKLPELEFLVRPYEWLAQFMAN